ncbi:hypothetical protein Tco_0262023 [Tanacetum coccineum]
MASMNTRLNIEKLDENIVQKHGGSKQVGFKQLGHKQVGFKQLGPGVETGFHGVQDEKRVWFEVELQGAQGDREAEAGANITVTGVPGQEGAEGNVAEKKKVKKSMKANLWKLLKYKAWLTRRSLVRGKEIPIIVSHTLLEQKEWWAVSLVSSYGASFGYGSPLRGWCQGLSAVS